jgi:aspartate/methionine/tyrosine aminotransferase
MSQFAAPSMAARLKEIEPFFVMEIMKEAERLQAKGLSIIHLSIGEPDFTAPDCVVSAATAALTAGRMQYTPATGIHALRDAIADDYARTFGVTIDPHRVVVTAGASAALLLALGSLVDVGAEVLMADPNYPCNRHFVAAFNGVARLIPCGPERRFQLDADLVRANWGPRTRGVLLATPSNPTGTSIRPEVLAATVAEVRQRGGFVIVDEIYQRLAYEAAPRTALALGDDIFVLNSFSKYFNMTGWRLGWMVVPPQCVAEVEKLAQNLFVCPSALAQHAAIQCFSVEALAIYESRRAEFRARRDYLLDALPRLGIDIPAVPDGAFYIYADIERFGLSSWEFAFELLRRHGVCVVPGRDFGRADTERFIRVSYATDRSHLEMAVGRIGAFLQQCRKQNGR